VRFACPSRPKIEIFVHGGVATHPQTEKARCKHAKTFPDPSQLAACLTIREILYVEKESLMGYDECICGVCGVEESEQLSLLFALVLLRFTLLVATFGLYVLVVDSKSFIDLGAESRLVLDAVTVLANL
jgi:hypothetical protein